MIRILDEISARESGIFSRRQDMPDIQKIVSDIIADVRANGDSALRAYGKKFDKLEDNTALEVTKAEMDEAYTQVDPELIRVLEQAAKNISEFHSRQARQGFEYKRENGAVLGMRIMPLAVAGLYIPGGTASYPSTVLMNAIPAKIAGVETVIMASPATGGKIAPEILAAAKIAGVDRIFRMGGAQAVAAMAYGTETVPRVDKIVGPGNAFVAEAKRQVFGQVAIDMIAGPSEILIVADEDNDPAVIASDMLAQSEHDKMASAVLVTDSKELADAVSAQLEIQLKTLPREEIARVAVDEHGMIILCDDLDIAVQISNELAPEHLELCVKDPMAMMAKVKNAGSVFLGKYTPESLGDYMAGPNHTLPTMGTARFSSPLSVDDFVKKSSYICFTREALKEVAKDISLFAEHEGLSAHGRSALTRFAEEEL